MASNILNIGKSALAAAQAGISVTGHNIANASTPGYSRQTVVQSSALAQNYGYGYIGQGTQVDTVRRVYNELLATQVNNAQASSSELTTYAAQMQQIDNLLADSAGGLSPALQDFFNSIQTLSGDASDASARQAMLSAGQALENRFHSLDNQLQNLRHGVNSQLTASVSLVNGYAQEIARLNDAIGKAMGADGQPPNDLMDQRDQLIAELSKQVKTTVVKQDGGQYNVFIGTGLPVVVGTQTYKLATVNAPTDGSRLEVAYQGQGGNAVILAETSLSGGVLGGLLQFRSQSLDNIQNELGLIAVTLAETFNAQHAQGLDADGQPGGAFFAVAAPVVNADAGNAGDAEVSAEIVDTNALTASNYRLQYDGSNYVVTKLSDGSRQTFSTMPQVVDGVRISLSSGSMTAGDEFLVKPTFNGAASFELAVSNVNDIAAGGPVLNAAAADANTGSGTISAPRVSDAYVGAPLTAAMTLSYDDDTGTLSGFPAGEAVTVTAAGVSTTYAAGTPVPYTADATIAVAGMEFQIGGAPADGDQFTVTPNTDNGPRDNRNALLLAGMQNENVMANGTTTYGGAFNKLVSLVGNKTRELQVTSKAETQMLDQAIATQQSESGVNLDEEATNLLRYQQAYQAAGKMMQIASQMFDVLLSLGR